MKSWDVKFFKMAIGQVKSENEHDIVARCPICGDSRYSKNKARLHLYEKNGVTLVNCFNGDCKCQNMSMYKFLKTFYPSLLFQYKQETFRENLKNAKGDYFGRAEWLNDNEVKNEVCNHGIQTLDLSQYFGDISQAFDYLKSRGIKYTEEFGKWYFGNQDLVIDGKKYKLTNSLIIPLYINGKMYGFYSRNIKEKVFYTFIHPSAVGYKIWNWFNIDKDKPVYIFEGIFDALSAYKFGLKNVIACMGAKIPDERLKELKDPIFCLDNDETGLKNILEYSKKYKVCVFKSKYKDCNEMMLNNVNVKDVILSNIVTGIVAQVKIRSFM